MKAVLTPLPDKHVEAILPEGGLTPFSQKRRLAASDLGDCWRGLSAATAPPAGFCFVTRCRAYG
jgi:hypothetical protein